MRAAVVREIPGMSCGGELTKRSLAVERNLKQQAVCSCGPEGADKWLCVCVYVKWDNMNMGGSENVLCSEGASSCVLVRAETPCSGEGCEETFQRILEFHSSQKGSWSHLVTVTAWGSVSGRWWRRLTGDSEA